ncbi:MAG: cache domain-containing protein, partial [Desulfovibrionaceae bacterium]
MKKYFLPFAIICILCLILGVGFTMMSIKLADAQQAGIRAQQELLVETLCTPVHNALQAARLGVENLATSSVALTALGMNSAPADPNELVTLQKMALLFPYVEFIAIVDCQNTLRMSSYPMIPGTKVVDDRCVAQSIKGLRLFSSPYRSPVTGNMVIAVTAPIAHENSIVGVAVAVINMQKLGGATTNRFELGATGYMSLLDDHGNIILHPDSSMVGRNVSHTNLGRQIMDQESGHAFG